MVSFLEILVFPVVMKGRKTSFTSAFEAFPVLSFKGKKNGLDQSAASLNDTQIIEPQSSKAICNSAMER